jgi:hypothetical protein
VAQTVVWTSLHLRRRADQLWLDIDAGNLTPDHSVPGDPRLRRTGPVPAYLAVRFPPQHLAEQVLPGGAAPVWPAGTRRAGVSRLVFRLPDDLNSIPLTDESMLSWGEFALQVSPAAQPRGTAPPAGTPIASPTVLETGVEAPWRMVLSPPGDARWAHAIGPVTHGDRTELWHTRMSPAAGDGPAPTLRALWCTDEDFTEWLAGIQPVPDGGQIPAPGLPFPMALTPRDRLQIVRATSDYTIPGFTPDPVDVAGLQLTSLGASVSLWGAWSPPPAVLSLLAWQHRAVLGRDQAVQVVSRGYLLPFGQPAALVRVVERALAAGPGGARIAALHCRDLLVVGRPTRAFPAFAQQHAGRAVPFARVEVITTRTPPLDPPTPLLTALGNRAFIPRVAGLPLAFGYTAVDAAGRPVTFALPAVFVDSVSAFAAADMASIRAAYNALPADGTVRRAAAGGQVLAYGPARSPGDTDVETHTLTFTLQEPLTATDAAFVAADQPRAHPFVSTAAVRLAPVAVVTGAATGLAAAHFDQRYLASGFGAGNLGEVFLDLTDPVDLTLPSDRGALMDPGLSIRALSRRLGPVGGDLDTLAGGLIDVPAMLAAAPNQPKIFGAVSLSSIVRAVPVPAPGQPADGAITLQITDGSGAPLSLTRARAAVPPGSQVRLSFEPKLQPDPQGILDFKPEAYGRVSIAVTRSAATSGQLVDFRLDVVILNGRPWRFTDTLPVPSSGPDVAADKPAFTLRLFGSAVRVIEVDFARLLLTVQTGKDVVVSPKIANIRFDGILKFVQKLRDAISGPGKPSSDTESSPWGVILAPTLEYLEAGLKLSLPDVPLGVLNLKNIRFALTLQVPYFFVPGNRRPLLLTFAFASREDPFLIAVYVWGGGGYATIGLRFGGIQLLEIGFQFGFYRQLGGGALSGSIELMVGFNFQMEFSAASGGNIVTLTGFVRARGKLEVVKIVTVSLELYLGLTYKSVPGRPGALVGQARVTLTVSVLFFSVSVSYVAEQQFSGDGGGDPTFADQMPTQALWDQYATAFALGG